MSEKKSLEENIKDIEVILEKMESGEISLEKSIELYKEGMALLNNCNDTLDKIEKELVIIKESNITDSN